MAIRLIDACQKEPAGQACNQNTFIDITIKQNNSIALAGIAARIRTDAPGQAGQLIEQHSIQTL
ncbi:MAG: hypothetical protein CVU71_05355 [Deltaproteobacteria bacterium HGW-Deltaproteobacteria-6]|nr:MAG: hypothetical protein CVU71_05355 [Deltaproteobacteria bacterium HGW-Deltaproteobacteria-6]